VIGPARTALDLRSVGTVVWATGYAPRYPWLDPGLLDRKGAVRHHGGILPEPGMYVLGLPFTRRRKSTFLDGFGPDAEELATHLAAHLDRRAAPTGAHRTAA
jgi:putative flavoprotein involved in K+ transport